MNGRSSRNKGFNYEREIVNFAREKGHESERMYGSNGESRGYHSEVDVTIDDDLFQAKRYKRVAKWLRPHESVQGVIFREDGNTSSLIVVSLEHYLKLKRGVKDEARADRPGVGSCSKEEQ